MNWRRKEAIKCHLKEKVNNKNKQLQSYKERFADESSDLAALGYFIFDLEEE